MTNPQSLREILESQLKMLDEKELQANNLEEIARKLRAEVDEKKNSILSALGVEEDSKKKAQNAASLKDASEEAVSVLSRKGVFTSKDIYRHIRGCPAARQMRKKGIMMSLRSFLGRKTRAKKLAVNREVRPFAYSLPTSTATKTDSAGRTPKDSPRKIWNLNKQDSLAMQILTAMLELENNGSMVTSSSIRNQLVEMELYTYDNLKRVAITNRITYLRSKRKLVSIKTKRGRETTYEFTEAGRKIVATLGQKK